MCNKIVFDKKEYFWKKKTNIDNNNSILGVRITTPPPKTFVLLDQTNVSKIRPTPNY